MRVTRRQFMGTTAALAGAAAVSPACHAQAEPEGLAVAHLESFFRTRGVVLSVPDLETLDWPRLAADAGLTTIGTHITPGQVAAFVQTEKGQAFLEACRERRIHVEHELHAMKDLLPRDFFTRNPHMFRMDDSGNRVADYNCCVHSSDAAEIVCENAVRYSELLPSDTGRYFYWIDDGMPMCRCSECGEYSDSEQALILENAMLAALRKGRPGATLAHLAYARTLDPPVNVEPAEGIFLEFAPIERALDRPLNDRNAKGRRGDGLQNGRLLDLLDANLAVFPADTAQVLEYWLDVSLFSGWKKPAVELPWRPDVLREDLGTYAARGVQHVTSFAVYIDGDYVARFGTPGFLREYGRAMAEVRP